MHPPDPPLADEEVLLRPYEPEDAHAVAEGFGHESVTRWFPVPVPFTLAEAEAFIERSQTRWKTGEQASFAVVDRHEGDLLGGVDVDDIDEISSTGEVGYWLRPGSRGRGAATRAVRLVCSWALDLGLHRLTLLAEPHNSASLGVAERAGFRRDRLLRAHDVDWRDGRIRHFWRYVLDVPPGPVARGTGWGGGGPT